MVDHRGIFKNCYSPTAKMFMYQLYVMRIFPLFFSRNEYVVPDSLLFYSVYSFTLLWSCDPILGHGIPLRGFGITHVECTDLGMTPLNE
jgi:hypothetical protein